MQVQNGNKVKIHYTGKLADGQVFDTSLQDGRDPLEFTVGQGMMIPGFETGVMGMEVGEKRTITMASDDAYGPTRDDLMFEVPITNVPPEVKVGDTLRAEVENGMMSLFTVTEVKIETVVLDGNHPLAGKDLTFDVELLEMQ
jgi:FKBP-type peptidyl-prolyl cis-trans isomerase 2